MRRPRGGRWRVVSRINDFSPCAGRERLTERQNDHTTSRFRLRDAKECVCPYNALLVALIPSTTFTNPKDRSVRDNLYGNFEGLVQVTLPDLFAEEYGIGVEVDLVVARRGPSASKRWSPATSRAEGPHAADEIRSAFRRGISSNLFFPRPEALPVPVVSRLFAVTPSNAVRITPRGIKGAPDVEGLLGFLDETVTAFDPVRGRHAPNKRRSVTPELHAAGALADAARRLRGSALIHGHIERVIITMSMADRDDFPDRVKLVLAQRVGSRCSHPECRALTTGPHTEADKRVSVGVAAHITAAAPGGPRYNPNLTPEDRTSADNGIWMCQTHGTLVDRDAERYPESLLREWKIEAEKHAEAEIGKTASASRPSAVSDKRLEVSQEAWQRLIKAVGTAQNRFGPGREVPVFMMLNETKAEEVILALPFSDEEKDRLRRSAPKSRDDLYEKLDTKHSYIAAHGAWTDAKNFVASNEFLLHPEHKTRMKSILDDVYSVLTNVKMSIEDGGAFRRDVSRTLVVTLNRKLDELEKVLREHLGN